ncbi:hypothetical protein FB567DRAFT_105219 [Paraphoma chrysanthemicola]|uniref:Secreted protein n=1 Tax=Paraphoma chrysanthemicola TaxID=798071 RepID=A0A8K0R090_9PLEO|nr:hypothetical protein FB567DRAFT_105219 [Paraphoma chrysanthemicola]
MRAAKCVYLSWVLARMSVYCTTSTAVTIVQCLIQRNKTAIWCEHSQWKTAMHCCSAGRARAPRAGGGAQRPASVAVNHSTSFSTSFMPSHILGSKFRSESLLTLATLACSYPHCTCVHFLSIFGRPIARPMHTM